MPDLPKNKVGIVSCSGEELPQGTITRLAALKVLEQMRPEDTVTICLPLFLAGGQGDRAFAKFYPTIAIDGCDKRCAARATEMYSSKPAASVIVDEIIAERGLGAPAGLRRLNGAGQQAVEATAERVAELVDELLGKRWDRRAGRAIEPAAEGESDDEAAGVARCSCGSAIPFQRVEIEGRAVKLLALPVIFQQMREESRPADTATARDILDTVKVYNSVPDGADAAYLAALLQAYTASLEPLEART
ncbi:MAG: putative zinc-binding protein [Anaerolineae bacterium]